MKAIAAVVLLWAGLNPGEFSVGYRRTTADAQIVDVWYPARNDGRSMTFGEYFHDRQDDAQRPLAGQAVYAHADASRLNGPYPLVLIAQGNGEDAADQAILAEYLASHGYVVASVPSPMIAHRMTAEDQIGTFAEEQALALEKASRAISKQFHTVPGREAVVGHSFGARAALLLAMDEPSIRAIVSLDGGIGTATGVSYLKQAPSFRENAPLPPLLHIYETLDAFMNPDFRFLESLNFRGLKLQQASDMHHVHFTTYGFAAAAMPEIAKATKAGPREGENVVAVAQSVLTFLDRSLHPCCS